MSHGKIWPEYWIDCSICDHHEPLGKTTKGEAVAEACVLGWGRSIAHKWVCKDCQKKEHTKSAPVFKATQPAESESCREAGLRRGWYSFFDEW